MLKELKFVTGAVARKDYVPELTHIRIRAGWAQGFNGTISSACKIDMNLDVMPWAVEMINAISACEETIAMSVTATGRLSIKSGKFKVYVNCLDMSDDALQTFPTPEGERLPINGDFIKMLRALQPFMADDASRPWAMGVMFEKDSSFATNNVMLAQYWHGLPFKHRVTIPAAAVNEIVKVKEEPTYIQATDDSLTVWFGNNKWVRTQLLEDQFPEAIHNIIEASGGPFVPIEEYPGFFAAVEKLKAFTNELNSIYFLDGVLSTAPDLDGDKGASVEVAKIVSPGAYNLKHLLLLKDIAAAVDFSPFPAAARFIGRDKRLRGVFMGARV